MILTIRLTRPFIQSEINALLTGKSITGTDWDDKGRFVLVTDTDPTGAEIEAIRRRLESENDVEETLTERAVGSYKNLQDYYGLTTPTDAQTRAVVRVLCRVVMALIRSHFRRLDAVD